MKIVIDIPENVKAKIDDNINACDLDIYDCVMIAVKNGTLLPKGHGRLIDAEELKKIIRENDVLYMTGFCVNLCDINNTPTIIEADKESEE